MKKMIEALKKGKAYDHISNNGYEMAKDDLIRIIKEYDYAIHNMERIGDKPQDIYNAIAEELEDYVYED